MTDATWDQAVVDNSKEGMKDEIEVAKNVDCRHMIPEAAAVVPQREVVVVVEERKIYLMSWVVQEVVGARSEGLQIPLEV